MRQLLFVVILGFFQGGFSQENPVIKGGNYFISNAVGSSNFELISSDKTKKGSELDSIENSNYSLRVTGIEADTVYFKFWPIKGKSDEAKAKNKALNGENDKVYSMSIKDFKNATSIVYNRVEWKYGIFTVPFKLRFSDFIFESNVNIGTSIGAKIRLYRKKKKALPLSRF